MSTLGPTPTREVACSLAPPLFTTLSRPREGRGSEAIDAARLDEAASSYTRVAVASRSMTGTYTTHNSRAWCEWAVRSLMTVRYFSYRTPIRAKRTSAERLDITPSRPQRRRDGIIELLLWPDQRWQEQSGARWPLRYGGCPARHCTAPRSSQRCSSLDWRRT